MEWKMREKLGGRSKKIMPNVDTLEKLATKI